LPNGIRPVAVHPIFLLEWIYPIFDFPFRIINILIQCGIRCHTTVSKWRISVFSPSWFQGFRRDRTENDMASI
jgi:hypothetical protein